MKRPTHNAVYCMNVISGAKTMIQESEDYDYEETN